MPFSLLALLLNPSLWEQVIKVATEVTALVNHPSVVGISQAVADTAAAVATAAPEGSVSEVAVALEGAGSAVASTYSSGQPNNVIGSVVAGITSGLSSLANHLSSTATQVAAVPVPPSGATAQASTPSA